MTDAGSSLATEHPDTIVSGARPLVTLALSAQALAERAPIAWTESVDELGPVRHAVIRPSGAATAFVLTSYVHVSGDETTVLGAHADRDLEALLGALRIRSDEIVSQVRERSHRTSPRLTPRELKLIQYLNEAYGKEKQLETTLQAQIKLAKPEKTLEKRLKDHYKETKQQSRNIEKRIKALGGKADAGPDLPGPDAVSGAVGGVTNVANKALAAAKGPVQALRGTGPEDNLLRNVRDAYWNEAEEIAHYNVIESAANALDDKETARLAKEHRRQEERMQKFLAGQIDKLVKSVVKAEIPAKERKAPAAASSSSRGRGTSRSSSSRSSSSGSSARKSSGTTARKSSGRTGRKSSSNGSSSSRSSSTGSSRSASESAPRGDT